MTRRYVLAWSFGATAGYVVGWLAGSAVRDQRDFRALRRAARRPEPRTAPRTGVETREAGNGAQTGAQRIDLAALHARPDYQEAMRREGMPWEPTVDLTEWMAERGLLHPLDEVAAEFGINQDEPAPCPALSVPHGWPCIRVGVHDEHWWRDPRTENPKESHA